ncbi:C6 transcription factor [Fusarium circinatum]|uniref:C6 transcription factor n=1 Tax=Fusarium circinatum TaxID=48490 RepID=A0A8H5WG79_FUSCI|nr:C6 transcription factor [Fusarium circinatum]
MSSSYHKGQVYEYVSDDPSVIAGVQPRPRPQPQHSRTQRLGLVRIVLLSLGTVVIVAVATFLDFLWWGAIASVNEGDKPNSHILRRILGPGWLLRFITISSLVYRVLYDSANLLTSVLLAALLIASVATQFTSTILLTDFSAARLINDSAALNVAFGFNYPSNEDAKSSTNLFNPYAGVDYWTSRPPAYLRFAEASAPPVQGDGIYDTGATARAFLPFTNSTQRVTLRRYEGPATVIDARVVCIRPRLSIHAINLTDVYMLSLSGSVSVPGGYEGLDTSYSDPSSFACMVDVGKASDRPLQQRISLCPMDSTAAFIQGGVRPDLSSYTKAYLLIKATSGFENWRDNGLGGTEPVTILESERTSQSQGTWQSFDLKGAPDTGIDATLCFANPIPWNYQISAASSQDGFEPTLQWNITTGTYRSNAVRSLLGSTLAPIPSLERGLLKLASPANWSTADASTAFGTPDTINYIWTALRSQSYNVSLSLSQRENGDDLPLLVPHRAHIGLFQEILAHTDSNAALAMQALFFTLLQMSYSDYTAEFDVSAKASANFSQDVVIPVQWRGFIIFCTIAGIHIALVTTITVTFFLRTRATALGNAWQAIGQAAEVTGCETVYRAAGMTDEQMKAYLFTPEFAIPPRTTLQSINSTDNPAWRTEKKTKKTRCDEDFPCGLCKSLDLQCKFTQRKATRNEASLGMIVNILRRIEGKIDDSKLDSNPTENHRSIAAALRPFNPRSPANSSEVLGVPSFLRQETIDSPAAPTDPNPAISFSAHQVLFWPAIQSALPESVKLMCQMQGSTYSTRLEASRPKLPHATSVDISSDWLSKLTNPILDQKTYFQRTLGVAIDGNFGICIESCIVLVVMALGSMGQKALQEAGFAGTPASSPYVGQDAEMPGLDFFNEARKRFGFLMCEQDLQACQFYLLSGLFYAEALRPIDWWAMLSKASACSAYFWNNVSRDRDEWMLDMQSRLFWITSMFEAVLSQELNLPPSNSLHLEEHIALPKFISAQDIASFGSFRYPGDDPFFHYHFLSQLAHRLILTRARNSLFHFNATADYPPEPVEDELIRQLEQWRERLPPMLQFDPKSPLTQADSPSDALVTAWLHARYFVARYHIGRPLLHRALERPASLTEGHLRKCRDAISAVLAWASVIQVTDTMRSCNPLKFFVCSQ